MTDSQARDGRSLVALAGLSIGLLFGGLAVGVALGGIMPLPYGTAAPIQHYVQTQPLALHVIAVAVFGSAVLLGIYAAVVGSRLRRLGVAGAGPAIAVAGGTLASGALGVTGLLGWILSQPDIAADATLVRALYLATFLFGGPGHVVALGVLIAGIVAEGALPRRLRRAGVAIAALCALTTLVLAWTALGPMLPMARVAALGWLLVAGARMPTRLDSVEPA